MMARDSTQFVAAVDYVLEMMGAGHQHTMLSSKSGSNKTTNHKREDGDGDDPLSVVALSNTNNDFQASNSTLNTTTTTTLLFNSRPHFEIIDIGGGEAVKIVSSEACSLTAALTELIKVCRFLSFKTSKNILRVENRKKRFFNEFLH